MNPALLQQMEHLFNPSSVAVVGASNTPGKWGFAIIRRVLETQDNRRIYAINNKTPVVLGLTTYERVTDVPGPVDFVVIAIPFQSVPQVMEDCVAKGIKAGLLVSAGLGETGEEGAKVEREILSIANNGGLRFVGPNCMGHINASSNFYTVGFAPIVKTGGIGLVAQSGGFTGHILHCGVEMGIGFSKVISSGNEADLQLEDYIEYLAQDPETKVITAYVEGFKNGRRFLKLAQETTKKKPIVIMKVGRTNAGAKAAKSHTGALSGSDIISDVALKQAGVIRVDEIEELFDIAAALLRQPLPSGRRVAILTGGGGHGVIATDACESLGLEIATLSQNTIEKIDQVLPPRWPHSNPVDTVAAGFVTYDCLWPIMDDENIDAILAVGSIGMSVRWGVHRDLPIAMPSHIRDEAMKWMDLLEQEELKGLDTAIERMDQYRKPIIITGMMLTPEVMETPVMKKLEENGLLVYPTPERAAKVLAHLCWYSEYLRRAAD